MPTLAMEGSGGGSAVGHAGKTAPMSCSPGPSPKKSGVTEQGHGEIIQPEDDQGVRFNPYPPISFV